MTGAAAGDRAGKQYWDTLWEAESIPRPFDPARDTGIASYPLRAFHAFFVSLLSDREEQGRLLEVGCARSAWLPYFALQLGLDVAGIDYSDPGCDSARAILAAAGIDGEVTCADLFAPPDRLVGAFDVVVSFGVVEHFGDTADALRAVGRFAKVGGDIVTFIPNLTGSIGLAQRLLNPAVLELHVPLTAEQLADAHRAADLHVSRSGYLLSTSFGVTNLNELPTGTRSYAAKRAAHRLLRGVSKLVWMLETATAPLPPTRVFAPYAFCVAQRPGAA